MTTDRTAILAHPPDQLCDYVCIRPDHQHVRLDTAGLIRLPGLRWGECPSGLLFHHEHEWEPVRPAPLDSAHDADARKPAHQVQLAKP